MVLRGPATSGDDDDNPIFRNLAGASGVEHDTGLWGDDDLDHDVSEDSDSEPPPKKPTADGSSGGQLWIDAITNTIWMPRRVCEKELDVELDDDIEEFYKKTELKVDGGVDSSRSLFPVSCGFLPSIQ
jgi:hypothetical protein